MAMVERPIVIRCGKKLLERKVGRTTKQDGNQFMESSCVRSREQESAVRRKDATEFRQVHKWIDDEVLDDFRKNDEVK